MTKGVIYLIYGPKVAERLVVSIWSLRKYWQGPVTVLCSTTAECSLLAIAAIHLNFELIPVHAEPCPHPHWLAKARVPEYSPYDETIYLDADTLVTGPIDDLFGHELTLTEHYKWTTRGSLTRRRIKAFAVLRDRKVDAMIEHQLNNVLPAVNGGVLAFRKDTDGLAEWYELTKRLPEYPLSEQTALQLLTSVLPHRFADERFNRMAEIGLAIRDVRIWHFYGQRHCWPNSQWIPAFQEACELNVGGLADWAGQYDRHVRRLLRDRGN